MMNCKHATRLLSEKLDRELSTKEKISLKMHIAMCSACRKFGSQMGDIRKISKRYIKKENLDEKK
ncbi:zf-HC2 domain-containing protein [Vibrio sp.]|uniref:Zf-HC2 domain-containing protein n=1 Tax=Vibrio viridaestus TaxID=2487322 RepID=A0A3N9TIR2_9VIBR|nr:zf-HC2 domain-containing protein [Vibrio viridaestus]MDC0610678.1 zf-HC2 domain-containing protein [Vibrio sp.]RQW63804.1 zf-HC2 domain-containing protein [Vibrio viridaestus]